LLPFVVFVVFGFFLIFINGKVKVFSLSAINFQD